MEPTSSTRPPLPRSSPNAQGELKPAAPLVSPPVEEAPKISTPAPEKPEELEVSSEEKGKGPAPMEDEDKDSELLEKAGSIPVPEVKVDKEEDYEEDFLKGMHLILNISYKKF